MAELVKELRDGSEALQRRISNPISLSAGTELFISFVTLFPHESAVSSFKPCIALQSSEQSFPELKTELIRQGKQYVKEALTYRTRIAELAFDFIKDDSVVC